MKGGKTKAHLQHGPLWFSPESRYRRPFRAAGARGERHSGGQRSLRVLQEVQGFPSPDGRARDPEPIDLLHKV